MFDIGFSEILVIGVVALVVVGPERLPKVARTMGHMFGRLQRYVNEVKADINREIELDQLRQLKGEMHDAARGLGQSVTEAAAHIQSSFGAARREIEQNLNPGDGPAPAKAPSDADAARAGEPVAQTPVAAREAAPPDAGATAERAANHQDA